MPAGAGAGGKKPAKASSAPGSPALASAPVWHGLPRRAAVWHGMPRYSKVWQSASLNVEVDHEAPEVRGYRLAREADGDGTGLGVRLCFPASLVPSFSSPLERLASLYMHA